MTTTHVDTVAAEARAALAAAADERALEAWRTAMLGRSGVADRGAAQPWRAACRGPAPRRRRSGERLKDELEAALEARREELRAAALAS